MHSQWGQRVHSELAKLDIKSLGRVGVLLGGRSGEREISLMSGGGVLEALHLSLIHISEPTRPY